jgi:hypothetical protein
VPVTLQPPFSDHRAGNRALKPGQDQDGRCCQRYAGQRQSVGVPG